jgi:hypothetical protein
VTPAVVVPGQVVAVAGTNFPAGASVTLAWDLGGISVTIAADGNGTFATAMVTPSALGNGTRLIAVTAPPEATSARASVLVQPSTGFQGPGSPAFRH